MVPAYQGFVPPDVMGGGTHNGLVKQFQCITCNCVDELAFQNLSLFLKCLHLRIENAEIVATALLHFIECQISTVKKILRATGVGRADGSADACSHHDILPFDIDGFSHYINNGRRDCLNICFD